MAAVGAVVVVAMHRWVVAATAAVVLVEVTAGAMAADLQAAAAVGFLGPAPADLPEPIAAAAPSVSLVVATS
jgi:hypothetical protein